MIGLEAVDELGVSGGKLIGGEVFGGDPGEGVAVEGLGFAGDEGAVEEAEADGFFGIGVGDFFDLGADGDFDAEFFAEFAREAVLESFTGLKFAAGEFPEAAEVIAGAALGDEELAVAEDEAGGDVDDFGHTQMGEVAAVQCIECRRADQPSLRDCVALLATRRLNAGLLSDVPSGL